MKSAQGERGGIGGVGEVMGVYNETIFAGYDRTTAHMSYALCAQDQSATNSGKLLTAMKTTQI